MRKLQLNIHVYISYTILLCERKTSSYYINNNFMFQIAYKFNENFLFYLLLNVQLDIFFLTFMCIFLLKILLQVVTKPEYNFIRSSMFQNISIAAWDPGKYNESLANWLSIIMFFFIINIHIYTYLQ